MNLLIQDPQPADQSYRLIPLTQGQFAKVDSEDYADLVKFKWRSTWDKKTRSWRAIRSKGSRGKVKVILMSRQIMNLSGWQTRGSSQSRYAG